MNENFDLEGAFFSIIYCSILFLSLLLYPNIFGSGIKGFLRTLG